MKNTDLKNIISKVAKESEAGKTKAEEFIQLVVFELDKEEYGVEIEDLKEIIRIPQVTPVPGAPDFISGILNLRGKIVVTLDLEKRFKLAREHQAVPQHIIIVEVGNSLFGVIVDKVAGVLRVPISQIKKAPGLVTAKIHAEFIKGVVVQEAKAKINKTEETKKKEKQKESRLIILIDLPKMLSDKELLSLGKITKEVGKID